MAGRKAQIDKDVTAHIKDCAKKHIDPNQMWTAIGDGAGCPGYPFLPHVKQGYDVKKKP